MAGRRGRCLRRDTFGPSIPPVPPDWRTDPLPETAARILHDNVQLLLPRLSRYIEERRSSDRRFTGAIESDPSPLRITCSLDDPIAVPSMVDTLLADRPDATTGHPEGVGHCPMMEAPQRFLDAVLPGLG